MVESLHYTDKYVTNICYIQLFQHSSFLIIRKKMTKINQRVNSSSSLYYKVQIVQYSSPIYTIV